MIKKVVVMKSEIDKTMAEAIANVCSGFDGLVMIETGKRTVNGNREEALLKSRAKPGERVRLVIEGNNAEEDVFQQLKSIMEG